MAEECVRRRLAAILVADMVGSPRPLRLIEQDEEGTRAHLRSLNAEIIDPRITADGGRIVKTTGDRVLAIFGYPTAHEDDAERTINAGLGVVTAVSALGRDISAWIGIATGMVVVGDIL